MSSESDWDTLRMPGGGHKPDVPDLGDVQVHWSNWAQDERLVADLFNRALEEAASAIGGDSEKALVKIMLGGTTPPVVIRALASLAKAVAETETLFWASYCAGAANMASNAVKDGLVQKNPKAQEYAAISIGAVMCLTHDLMTTAEARYPGIRKMGEGLARATDPDGSARAGSMIDLKNFLMKNLPKNKGVEAKEGDEDDDA